MTACTCGKGAICAVSQPENTPTAAPVFGPDDAAETQRLLDGIAFAERDRKALKRTAIKAQEALDNGAREVQRWARAYDEHVRKLKQKANRG